jgi:site-specific DNA recombinase
VQLRRDANAASCKMRPTLVGREESPAISRNRVATAKKLAMRLPSLPSDDLRDLLATFLHRVVIQEDSIKVMIRRKDVRQLLENSGRVQAANLLGGQKPPDANDLISLSIEAKRKRFGGEVHLVVPPNSIDSVRHPKPSLIKAVARAHGWYEKIVQGNALDMRSLARQVGLTERYVGKVFGCALLAPDIIESILEGRQPHDLNFEKLCQHIPLSWAEQHERFGFTTVSRPQTE